MKTVPQIAADCGLSALAHELKKRVEMQPYRGVLSDIDNIIGALYRRIEKLEEEKEADLYRRTGTRKEGA